MHSMRATELTDDDCNAATMLYVWWFNLAAQIICTILSVLASHVAR